MMTIRRMQVEAFRTALEKGWWDFARRPEVPVVESPSDLDLAILTANIPEKLMLIVTEAAEAMESYRDASHPILEEWCSDGQKPEGLPSELSDIVIRVADLSGALGIDLEGAVERKLAYNRTRSHRHGNKRA